MSAKGKSSSADLEENSRQSNNNMKYTHFFLAELRLTSDGQRAGGGDGRDGVGRHAFVNPSVPPAGLHDREKLPAIWMRHQVEPLIHLQRSPVWEHAAHLLETEQGSKYPREA